MTRTSDAPAKNDDAPRPTSADTRANLAALVRGLPAAADSAPAIRPGLHALVAQQHAVEAVLGSIPGVEVHAVATTPARFGKGREIHGRAGGWGPALHQTTFEFDVDATMPATWRGEPQGVDRFLDEPVAYVGDALAGDDPELARAAADLVALRLSPLVDIQRKRAAAAARLGILRPLDIDSNATGIEHLLVDRAVLVIMLEETPADLPDASRSLSFATGTIRRQATELLTDHSERTGMDVVTDGNTCCIRETPDGPEIAIRVDLRARDDAPGVEASSVSQDELERRHQAATAELMRTFNQRPDESDRPRRRTVLATFFDHRLRIAQTVPDAALAACVGHPLSPLASVHPALDERIVEGAWTEAGVNPQIVLRLAPDRVRLSDAVAAATLASTPAT